MTFQGRCKTISGGSAHLSSKSDRDAESVSENARKQSWGQPRTQDLSPWERGCPGGEKIQPLFIAFAKKNPVDARSQK
jgi:hypothetical protein